MTKICRKCGIEKELTEFYFRKESNKYRNDCKDCFNIQKKNYQKQKIMYYKENPINKKMLGDYKTCSYCGIKKEVSQFSFRKDNQKYRNECLKCLNEKKKEYVKNNPEKRKKQSKKYNLKNRKYISFKKKQYHLDKLKNNPLYKLKRNIQRRTLLAVKSGAGKKQGSTIELIGCSWKEMQKHLKSTMYNGMTWQDYLDGKVHIDHIKPISSFDLTTLEGQKVASHYTNLQLLWAKDNLEKGDRLDWVHPRDRD